MDLDPDEFPGKSAPDLALTILSVLDLDILSVIWTGNISSHATAYLPGWNASMSVSQQLAIHKAFCEEMYLFTAIGLDLAANLSVQLSPIADMRRADKPAASKLLASFRSKDGLHGSKTFIHPRPPFKSNSEIETWLVDGILNYMSAYK